MSGLEQGGKHLRMTEVQKQTKRSLELTLVVNGKEVRESLAKISIIVGLLLNLKASFSNTVPFSGTLHNRSESAFYRDDKSMVEIYAHSD